MATGMDNREFLRIILPAYPLDAAIEWIKENLTPDDVFGEDALSEWATNNGFTFNGKQIDDSN